MLKFVLQFLVYFAVWFFNVKRKKSWLAPSNFIFFLYSLCALLGIPSIYLWNMRQALGDEYWIPTFYFVICTLFFIYPFYIFNESSLHFIKLPNRRILNLFSNVIIILSLYSIFYYSTHVMDVFSTADLGEARTQTSLGNESYTGSGLLNTIASVSASLNIFAIILFFVYYILGGSPIKVILLLVSSLSEPIQILTFVGRDGIVFWIFAFTFCYLFFRPYMNKEKENKIWKISLIMLALLILPFWLISASRFDESDYGLGGSIVCYLGQGFINGPLLFGIDNLNYLGGGCFPLFFEITGIKPPQPLGMVEYGDWKSWSFSTSIGSFYINLGPVGLLLVLLFLFLIFRLTILKQKTDTFYFQNIIIYLLCFRLVAEGVFYFREYSRGGNLMIILFLLFSLIFSIIGYRKGIVLVKRN